MPKRRREKHHKHSKSSSEPLEYKLLTYAALGKETKVGKLLARHTRLDVNFFDAHGNTALHQAHLGRHGADARAEDVQGNTPGHLAAAKGHLTLLASLLQSTPSPNVEAHNAKGESIQDLAVAAMSFGSDASSDDEPLAGPSSAAKRARLHHANAGFTLGPPEELDDESEWQARLREESGAELRGGDEEDWDSYGGFFAEPSFAAPGRGPPEDEDAFARRIWQEMEKRKRQQSGDAAAAARSYFSEQTKAEAARQQAAFDAAQHSRQILEEEKAKDRAWREAVLKGDLGSRRAKYEARWHSFAIAHQSEPIRMAHVPWLVDDLNEDPAQLASFVLYGAITPEEKRKRSRGELMRWHPDKFVSKFGSRLYAQDRTSILDKVNAISQLLNTINAAV
ncbi:TPA: hypothetical protein ACH3X3_006741 [Trebouxia sp. C0006]